jgi:hypothetical protein
MTHAQRCKCTTHAVSHLRREADVNNGPHLPAGPALNRFTVLSVGDGLSVAVNILTYIQPALKQQAKPYTKVGQESNHIVLTHTRMLQDRCDQAPCIT